MKRYTKEEVRELLFDDNTLLERAASVKREAVGNVTYLRGLIELSNECIKSCYYCGIRNGNLSQSRYRLTTDEVLQAAQYAIDNRYGSIAVQAGEQVGRQYTGWVTELVERITELSDGRLGITLSLGEQRQEVYREWRKAGASRYLLRVESSNPELYRKIHPTDELHSFDRRVECLHTLKNEGYQLGTGVMIGLPFQQDDDLVGDLLFMQDMDIDMCGMGPYLEHKDTPLYAYRNQLLSQRERFDLTIRMVAALRVMMPNINIASTTALQAIDPLGREIALRYGANVIMPNITPVTTRSNYKLYENKPISEDCLDVQDRTLFERIAAAGDTIGFDEQGNSLHYKNKN